MIWNTMSIILILWSCILFIAVSTENDIPNYIRILSFGTTIMLIVFLTYNYFNHIRYFKIY